MIEWIVLHHSLTRDGKTVSWGAIRDWHMGITPGSPYRFRDIGYHGCVELIGNHYEILIGRIPGTTGAHAKEMGMNHRSIGVCVVGNWDIAEPPKEQLDKLRELCKWFMKIYYIAPQQVIGDRDVGLMAGMDWRDGHSYKTCPGKLFPLDAFRQSLL